MIQIDPKKRLQRFLRLWWRRVNPPPKNLAPPPLAVSLPQSHIEAAKSLSDSALFKRYHVQIFNPPDSTRLRPEMYDFYLAFRAELQRRNIPLRAFEFFRDDVTQERYFARGTSKARAGSSPHQWGCAIDMIHAHKGWDLTRLQWAVIGAIGKEVARKRGLDLIWGGDFKSLYDPAHWELRFWREHRKYARLIGPEAYFMGFMPLETYRKWRLLPKAERRKSPHFVGK